jgi:hypothetical protein
MEAQLNNAGYSQAQRLFKQGLVVIDDLDAWSKYQSAAGIEPIAVLTRHLTRHAAEELGVKHIIENATLLEPELAKFTA